MWFPNSDI